MVTYDPDSDWKSAGTHQVIVEDIAGGNYIIDQITATFTITESEQNPLEIVGKPSLVYYGARFTLSTRGSSGDGAITWESSDDEIAAIDATGLVTVKGTGAVTITAKKAGTTNYAESTAEYPFSALSKPITDGDGSDAGGTDSDSGDSSNTDGTGSDTGDDGNTGGTDSSTGSGSNAAYIGSNTSTNYSPATDGSNAVSSAIQTSVQNGAARTVVNTAAGDKLVREAVASQSENVVIKPEITGDVTKAEVSIPTSTVGQLKSETSAALTVSTPVADVTIPNGALDTLSSAGGTVSVVTEQVDNAVSLRLTAGGQNVESVPGGVTLMVPVEDAGPGTVAVLVHNDGTRVTIRKAVPENGELSVQLDGSATVEIVDNSKSFADVPAEDWAADAVAFASAHELFNGTSDTTFSPDQPMSRAMLVTVLYNLEGCPEQSLTGEFSDVNSDAWYAAGVSWAMGNGILNGYGNDQLNPAGLATRVEAAQMLKTLWKTVKQSGTIPK